MLSNKICKFVSVIAAPRLSCISRNGNFPSWLGILDPLSIMQIPKYIISGSFFEESRQVSENGSLIAIHPHKSPLDLLTVLSLTAKLFQLLLKTQLVLPDFYGHELLK